VLDAGAIQKVIEEGVPLTKDFGLEVVSVGEKESQCRIPFESRFVRPGGTISGPVIMSLADAAMYAAIMGTLGKLEMAVTSQLSVSFLKRVSGAPLEAKAKILKIGERLAYCEVSINLEGEEDLVAHATGTYSLPPKG
jgi:uncharacterized protein (TIGR00369 family)